MVLSKLRPLCQTCVKGLLVRRLPLAMVPVRRSGLIPPTQYDTRSSKNLNILYVMRVYWETIPLFLVSATVIILVVLIIAWTVQNKVDVVFTPYSRNNISRTMDLRNPSVHKIVLINQRYAPWPEMQDVLDKMKAAEKRLLSRAQTCSFIAS